MAIHTALDLGGARRIGACYGLSVTAIRGILAGSVNTNYECSLAGGGRVFLRIYEEQDEAGAAREHRLLKHFSAAGSTRRTSWGASRSCAAGAMAARSPAHPSREHPLSGPLPAASSARTSSAWRTSCGRTWSARAGRGGRLRPRSSTATSSATT